MFRSDGTLQRSNWQQGLARWGGSILAVILISGCGVSTPPTPPPSVYERNGVSLVLPGGLSVDEDKVIATDHGQFRVIHVGSPNSATLSFMIFAPETQIDVDTMAATVASKASDQMNRELRIGPLRAAYSAPPKRDVQRPAIWVLGQEVQGVTYTFVSLLVSGAGDKLKWAISVYTVGNPDYVLVVQTSGTDDEIDELANNWAKTLRSLTIDASAFVWDKSKL